MVLEEASTPTEAFTSDAPPASDIDPYSTQNPPFTSTRNSSYATVGGGAEKIYVNMNNLPKPFALIGEGEHPPMLVDSIQDSCRFAQRVMERPATQEEADAFAFHAAKAYRIASYGPPIGGVLASVQFWRNMGTFRFPGYSPFKEGSRLSADQFGPLRGQMARTVWHSLRLPAYLLLGTTLGSVFFGSYALSVSLAGRAMDPRLKDFTDRLRQMQKEGADLQGMRRAQDADGTTQNETFEQRRQRRQVQSMNRDGGREQSRSAQNYDDMSPTGGAFGSEYNDSSSDTGLMSDSQLNTQQVRQQTEHRSSTADSAGNTSDHSNAAPQRPTSSTSNPQRPQQSSGGSSWDRLRQQAANNGGQGSGQQRQGSSYRAQGEQRQGSTVGDSFSFSESDEERQLAKGEAQRDFDARLDRERLGKDFEDKGRGQKRW